MIKLALECPVQFMGDLLPLTDFDFVLAHLVKGEYLEAYQGQQKAGRYLVLDNGTNELGEPCSLKEMDRVAGLLNPQTIIPPDWLGDAGKTTDALKEAEMVWGRPKILPVVQGDDWHELDSCLTFYEDRGYTSVALPYDVLLDRKEPLNVLGMKRQEVVQYITTHHPTLAIHLLGLNSLTEASSYQHHSQVIGIDTGAPFLNATLGYKFGVDTLVPKGTYIDYDRDYIDWGYGSIRELAKENIRYLKGLINGSITYVKD